ncbi:MAG: endonuclease III [Ruminococcus sp.]|jgi:endonuclease-3|nr:endonuclease III [Ruminococcus sp.]
MPPKSYLTEIINTLKSLYPDPACNLSYSADKPWQLLIAARLSAQCTDLRVNKVTPGLFERFPELFDFAATDAAEIAEIIKPCGLFNTKAASIKAMAQKLITDFGGEIPDSLDKLLTLPGVGRKTANLILGDIFHLPAIVTDTHFIRITYRLRLTDSKNPETVERDLRTLLPPDESSDFCHRIVFFGRDFCKAQNPRCDYCKLQQTLKIDCRKE